MYNIYVLFSVEGLRTIAGIGVPFFAIMFFVYGISIRIRRSPIIELHHNVLGFLAHYEVFAEVLNNLYRDIGGDQQRSYFSFSAASETVRRRLAIEEQRFQLERELLFLLIGLLSITAAYLAFFELLSRRF